MSRPTRSAFRPMFLGSYRTSMSWRTKRLQPAKSSIGLIPANSQIALDHAKATLANTRLTIENLKASYRTALNNIASQQAVVADGQATFDRFSVLIKSQLAISKAQYDQAHYALDADKQKLASLEQ